MVVVVDVVVVVDDVVVVVDDVVVVGGTVVVVAVDQAECIDATDCGAKFAVQVGNRHRVN